MYSGTSNTCGAVVSVLINGGVQWNLQIKSTTLSSFTGSQFIDNRESNLGTSSSVLCRKVYTVSIISEGPNIGGFTVPGSMSLLKRKAVLEVPLYNVNVNVNSYIQVQKYRSVNNLYTCLWIWIYLWCMCTHSLG